MGMIGKKGKKQLILLSLAILLTGFGVWFTTTNAYTLLKGYLLYKTSHDQEGELQAAAKPAPSHEPDEPELKGPEPEVHTAVYNERPSIGDDFGELHIPKLEATLPIFHGTDEDELAKGVGHFADSVLPGEDDNTVLSGHRDTVFRELGEVGKGDLLIVKTIAGEFTYRVKNVRIVDADDRTVIVPKPKATLTVSTCYPFDFIGDAPDRYILVADLISSKAGAEG